MRAYYVSIRQNTPAYDSIRQHTSAYVNIEGTPSAGLRIRQLTSAHVSIRQHTSAHVSTRQQMSGVLEERLRHRARVWPREELPVFFFLTTYFCLLVVFRSMKSASFIAWLCQRREQRCQRNAEESSGARVKELLCLSASLATTRRQRKGASLAPLLSSL